MLTKDGVWIKNAKNFKEFYIILNAFCSCLVHNMAMIEQKYANTDKSKPY